MSTPKFTPGPWEYDGKFTIGIPAKFGIYYFRTNKEDAVFIATAPEMHEALTDLCNVLDKPLNMIEFHRVAKCLIKAKSVLNKASGL